MILEMTCFSLTVSYKVYGISELKSVMSKTEILLINSFKKYN